MTFPDENAGDYKTYDSVALFLQGAYRIRHDFAPDAAEFDAIARICRMAEGLPLAVELAAAWTNLLSVEEIASEMESGLGLLKAELRV